MEEDKNSNHKKALKNKAKSFPGCIVLENKFVKSPPPYSLRFFNSWKERDFVLIKLDNDAKPRQTVLKARKKSINGCASSFLLCYWHDEHERRRGVEPIRKYLALVFF
jgi:hypothetical protein